MDKKEGFLILGSFLFTENTSIVFLYILPFHAREFVDRLL